MPEVEEHPSKAHNNTTSVSEATSPVLAYQRESDSGFTPAPLSQQAWRVQDTAETKMTKSPRE